MAAGIVETLEDLIDRATNPNSNESNAIHAERFSNQVNREFDGPCVALRLIVAKLHLHQEIISLQALNVLETCVQNCGKKFHQELGKYRFLNELIKLLSPKYDGNVTAESVKKRIIEVFYSWYIGLPNEGKIAEAYRMLKQQGVIERDPQDPQYKLASYASRPRDTVFEDEEKSKLLASLLRSTNPEDLQAANRLIKTMVKQEEERLEKVSRRIQELETVANNVKLLNDMLANFSPSMPLADREVMKDLYDTCLNMRPQLFRLAGASADDKDDSIGDILKASDDLTQVIDEYKSRVLSQPVSGQRRPAQDALPETRNDTVASSEQGGESSLLDLGLDVTTTPKASIGDGTADAASLVHDQFKLLGLDSPVNTQAQAGNFNQIAPPVQQTTTAGLFSTAAAQPMNLPQSSQFIGFQVSPMYSQATLGNFQNPQTIGQRHNFAQFPGTPNSAMPGHMPPFRNSPPNIASRPQKPLATQAGVTASGNVSAKNRAVTKPFDVLDFDVFSSFKSEGSQEGKTSVESQRTPSSHGDVPLLVDTPRSAMHRAKDTTPMTPPPAFEAKPPLSAEELQPASGNKSPTPGIENSTLLPMTDTLTPLENKEAGNVLAPNSGADGYNVPQDAIQPVNAPPVSVYDKNGIRTVIHMAKDSRPNANPNVAIMVLSTMSTCQSAVKQFGIQAAVPKSMRVKLQPPSGSDLPGYNPLLPPAAITQVMLVANPRKEKIKIKFLLRYQVDGQMYQETANVDNYPNS